MSANCRTIAVQESERKMAKTARIEARMEPEVKELIEFAAALENTTSSAFMIKSLIEASTEVINNPHTIILTDEQFDKLEKYLNSAYEPNENLIKLAKRKRKYVVGKI